MDRVGMEPVVVAFLVQELMMPNAQMDVLEAVGSHSLKEDKVALDPDHQTLGVIAQCLPTEDSGEEDQGMVNVAVAVAVVSPGAMEERLLGAVDPTTLELTNSMKTP